MKISPGPAAAQMRAARFTVPPKKSPPSWIGSPVLMPMPMAIRVPVWFRFALPRASWIATAQMIAPFAVVKATMKLSPWVFTTLPPNVSICLRTIARPRTHNAACLAGAPRQAPLAHGIEQPPWARPLPWRLLHPPHSASQHDLDLRWALVYLAAAESLLPNLRVRG